MKTKILTFSSMLLFAFLFNSFAFAGKNEHKESHLEDHKEVHKEEMKKAMSHKPEIMPFDTKENNAYKEYGRKKIMQIFQNSDYLSLTEEQLKSLKSLRNDCMKKIIRSNADKKIAILELVESLNKTEPDLEGIKKKLSEIAKIEINAEINHLETYLSVRKILSSEQLKKLDALPHCRMEKKFKKGIY